MISYQITIQMSAATAAALQQRGYTLCAFRAVSGAGAGVPVAWLTTQAFEEATQVEWTPRYQAYLSPWKALGQNVAIVPSASFPLFPGMGLAVTGADSGHVVGGGPAPGAIAILNQSTQPLICGISQQGGAGFTPTCAFPLPAGALDLITPLEQAFLMFCTAPVRAGTVVEQSLGPGVLVNLTGTGRQAVSFDIDAGWSPLPWAQVYPPGTNLVPLLIQAAAAPVEAAAGPA